MHTKWNEVLGRIDCGGYYSENPCRSTTCNLKHDFCARHKKLLQPQGEIDGKKSTSKSNTRKQKQDTTSKNNQAKTKSKKNKIKQHQKTYKKNLLRHLMIIPSENILKN